MNAKERARALCKKNYWGDSDDHSGNDFVVSEITKAINDAVNEKKNKHCESCAREGYRQGLITGREEKDHAVKDKNHYIQALKVDIKDLHREIIKWKRKHDYKCQIIKETQ